MGSPLGHNFKTEFQIPKESYLATRLRSLRVKKYSDTSISNPKMKLFYLNQNVISAVLQEVKPETRSTARHAEFKGQNLNGQ